MFDILLIIICGLLALTLIVVVHEAGHLFFAKLFRVGVSEFSIGLPGPSWGFVKGGTRYSVTPILLGGFCNIKGADEPRSKLDTNDIYEQAKTFEEISFIKRVTILFGGILFNLVFALVLFMVIATIAQLVTGAALNPLRGIVFGFDYIAQVVVAIVRLINPATFSETIEQSSSVIGVAVVAKNAAASGPLDFTMIVAALSISIGLMNLIPLPPLDGGRILFEAIEFVSRRKIPQRVSNLVSTAGFCLLILLFLVVTNQDIMHLVNPQ